MIIFVSVIFAIKRIFSIQSFIMRHPRETMTFFFQFTDRLGTKRVVLKPNFKIFYKAGLYCGANMNIYFGAHFWLLIFP